ncbi:unnamed protein product [Sphagnum balticum]
MANWEGRAQAGRSASTSSIVNPTIQTHINSNSFSTRPSRPVSCCVGHEVAASNSTLPIRCNSDGVSVSDTNREINTQVQEMDCANVMSLFCNGYNECAGEAIRYLIEEEGLRDDDPLVISLKQHLLVQQTEFLLQYFRHEQQQEESQTESTYFNRHGNQDALPDYDQAVQWLNNNTNYGPADDSDYYSAATNSDNNSEDTESNETQMES